MLTRKFADAMLAFPPGRSRGGGMWDQIQKAACEDDQKAQASRQYYAKSAVYNMIWWTANWFWKNEDMEHQNRSA